MATNINEMIEQQLKKRNITDEKVLEAMKEVDRKLFVPDDMQEHAYEDRPLPIGEGQTISQPYIVAFMAEQLGLTADSKVLEIGTGCGYNAAIMGQIAKKVYSIEIVGSLAKLAKENLKNANISNVEVKQGDGFEGWEEYAPFDCIALTAAPPQIPTPIKTQLKIGGKIIAPVGTNSQRLLMLTKTAEDEFEEKNILMVSFVPMQGKAQQHGSQS